MKKLLLLTMFVVVITMTTTNELIAQNNNSDAAKQSVVKDKFVGSYDDCWASDESGDMGGNMFVIKKSSTGYTGTLVQRYDTGGETRPTQKLMNLKINEKNNTMTCEVNWYPSYDAKEKSQKKNITGSFNATGLTLKVVGKTKDDIEDLTLTKYKE